MPKIQITQQRTTAQGMGAAPNARGERVISGFGENVGAIQRGLGEIREGALLEQRVDQYEAKLLDEQKENDAIVSVSKTLSDSQIKWSEHLMTAQEQAQGDAAGFTPKVLTDFDKYAEETVRNAPTEKSKKYLGDRLNSLRTSIAGQALSFEAQTRRNARMAGMQDSIDTRAKIVQDNPDSYPTAMAESMAEIDALAIPPDEKLKLKDKLQSTLPYATVLGRIMRDPKGEAARLKKSVELPTPAGKDGGASSFDNVMEFIFKKEGGYNANDGNGPVNFGINQAANPDVDVKSLTKAGAKELYLKRYWNEINGDQLSPGVALMAMDAAVNQGVGFARKMLEASGGDLNKMEAIRAQRYAQLVRDNPARYAKYERVWNARLADASTRAAELGGDGVRTYSLAQAYDATPEAVKPINDPAVDALSFTQRIQLLQQADTMANQQMSLAREQLKGKIQDFAAMASSGVAIPPESVPSVQELQTAHGDVEGLRIFNDDIKPMMELNGDLRRMSTMSLADRTTMLQSRAPAGGEGFADAQRRYAVMVQADGMLRKELETDPSAYAMKYSDTVKSAFDNLQKVDANDMAAKAAAARAYVTATMAEQKRIGVTSPVILPKSLTDNIVRQFYQQGEGAMNAATLIAQQSALWGEHWPEVYGQMAKDLPSSALVIGTGLKPAVAELVARASTLKQTEIEEGLARDEVKSMKEKVQANMTEFQVSLAQQPGGIQMFNVFNEQITKLATMYMRMGDAQDKASQKAYDDVVGSKYNFIENANNQATNYRVPAEFDSNAVAKGADRALASLSMADLPAFYDDRMRNSLLKQEGYWITDPRGERGLVLYANGAVVKNRAGQPIMKTWQELATMATPRAAPTAQDPMGAPITQQDFEFGNVYGAP